MKSFQEAQMNQKIVFTFGRFQPPTIGHEKMFQEIVHLAHKENAEARIYISKTHDNKRNPLSFIDKIKFIKIFYPNYAKYLSKNPEIITPFKALEEILAQGFKDIVFVVGADRVEDFKNVMNTKKIIEQGAKSFKIVSAGDRDPDSEDDVEGMSASKMRDAAVAGKFSVFITGLPRSANSHEAKKLYDLIRHNLHINNKEGIAKMKEDTQHPIVPNEKPLWQTFKQWFFLQDEAFQNESSPDEHDKGDYLVYADGKGHMPVRRHGKLDRKLMGSAKGVLTKSSKGQKYEGPDAAKAVAKLKALYRKEKMDWKD
jgi:nicotinic acid mononucleotide adenylyltransferase